MSIFDWPALSDRVWGTIAVSLAVLILIWLIRYVKRHDKAAVTADAHEPPMQGADTSDTDDVVNFKAVFAEYEARRGRYEKAKQEIEVRLAQLRASELETLSPEDLLQLASAEEFASVAAALRLPAVTDPAKLAEGLRAAGSHSAAVQSRKLRGLPPYVPYCEVLCDVARKIGAQDDYIGSTDAQVEKAIIVTSLAKAIEKADAEERARLMKELEASQRKLGKKVGVATGTIALANLSGFGLYVAASTILGSLTSVLGVTLPFAVYTGMSTTIATLIGPVGWMALIAGGVAVVGGVNYKKTVLAVVGIATIRSRLMAERDEEIDRLRCEPPGDLAGAAENLAAFRAVLERMVADGSDSISRAKVPF